MNRRQLIFNKGVGAIVEIDPRTVDWDNLYKQFAQAAGIEDKWPSSITLWPDCCFAGVYWDWELAGPDGASYRLHIMPYTSRENERQCKKHIKRSFDCVQMITNRIKRLVAFKFEEDTE